MKQSLSPLFILMLILFSACKPKDPLGDAYKFIDLTPHLVHDRMQTAFDQASKTLQYKVAVSVTKGTLLAKSTANIEVQYSLLASPLNYNSASNEFAISFLQPGGYQKDSLQKRLAPALSRYKRSTYQGHPIWLSNGWMIQIKEPNIIQYSPTSTSTINDN